MKAKIILSDIVNAFCLSSQNLDRAYRLSGIKASFYNGKRSNEQLRKLLLRAITEDKAKEIINKMPFPYIETANGNWIKTDTDNFENILVPLEKKKGYRMECVSQNYTLSYR